MDLNIKILAIDCCLKLTGVALMINDDVMHYQEDLGREQSRTLPLVTAEILRRCNTTWNDLDYIALTNGPGYFTGIRVAASYATGLAYACGKNIIPVSTFELLPYIFYKKTKAKKILTLIYSGHGFVYGYCSDYLEPGEYSHEQIKAWLKYNPDATLISDDPDKTIAGEKVEKVVPDVVSLCELAYMNREHAIPPTYLKILYFKAPQGVNNYSQERNE